MIRPAVPRGLGCDTEESRRFREVLQRSPGFLRRWFAPRECRWIEGSPEPEGLAARTPAGKADRACLLFCAKEAMIKACWEEDALLPSQVEIDRLGETADGAWQARAVGRGTRTLQAELQLEACPEGFLAWCIRP